MAIKKQGKAMKATKTDSRKWSRMMVGYITPGTYFRPRVLHL